MYGISSNILVSRNSQIPNKALQTSDFNKFKKYVDFFTIKSSRFYDEDNSNFVGVSLQDGGAIVSKTLVVTKELVLGNGWLTLLNDRLYLKFWDKAGNFRSIEVTSFKDIDKIRFFLKNSKQIDNGEEGDEF
jgi:hypothetical protein